MDFASFSIDRHTPKIPPRLWLGLEPDEERRLTRLKNYVVLPRELPPELVQRSSRARPEPSQRTISQSSLDMALGASKVSGDLEDDIWEYLELRGLSRDEVKLYGICSTEKLTSILPPAVVEELSLYLPDGSPIIGVSLPVFHLGEFFGFVTRVLNRAAVKYTISVPHRLCYGLKGADEVYVVEGVFDAIAVMRFGLNPLGLGDSQPNYYKMLMASGFSKVNLAFDNDYAGLLGSIKAYIILTKMIGMSSERICFLRSPSDPGTTGWSPELLVKTTYDQVVELAKDYRRERR